MSLIPPLTARRIQLEAGALAIFVWINVAVGAGVLGRIGPSQQFSDFFQFYVQGAVALQHKAALLYDFDGQTRFAHELLPETHDVPCQPIVPPQVSVLFSIFARMTYSHAELLWMLITCAGYAFCCYLLWLACSNLHRYRVAVALAAAAFTGLPVLILFGQTTVIALASFTCAFYCLRSKHLFAAGLAIGMLAYKPQLGLVAAGVFLLTRTWPVVAGALFTGVGQYALACWWYRKLIAFDFLHAWWQLNSGMYQPKRYLMHSLRPFWQMLLPSPILAFCLYVITAFIVFLGCLRIWKSANPLSLRFSALLLATVLVDPHLFVYDQVVLAPALMLLTDWWVGLQAGQSRVFTALLYLTYCSPLLVRIVESSRFAPIFALLSVVVSAALFAFVYLQSCSEHTGSNAASKSSPPSRQPEGASFGWGTMTPRVGALDEYRVEK